MLRRRRGVYGKRWRPGCYGGARAPVEEPRANSFGGAKERKDFGGDAAVKVAHAVVHLGAPSAAAGGLYGKWPGYSESCCCAEQRRFRKNQVTQRDSVARCPTFENLRLAAEQGSQMAWSVNTGVIS
jgi:hypothetical protein